MFKQAHPNTRLLLQAAQQSIGAECKKMRTEEHLQFQYPRFFTTVPLTNPTNDSCVVCHHCCCCSAMQVFAESMLHRMGARELANVTHGFVTMRMASRRCGDCLTSMVIRQRLSQGNIFAYHLTGI